MKCLPYLFCFALSIVYFKPVSTETYVLYDTKAATSDLDWTLHPDYNGWEELSGLGLDGNAIRYHQVCNPDAPNQDNWARSPFIDAKSAKRVYIDIEFSVMKCPECRETFTMYYYPSPDNVASSTFPPWKEKPFVKIDTVAAGSRFVSSDAGPDGINRKTLEVGPLHRRGLYIAVQDQGACMSLVSMKLYYHYCPEVTFNLAYFPKTVAGGDLASLIPVDGKCVSNAVYTTNGVPKYRCNSNGEWKVPTGTCQCRTGYSPNNDYTSCEACPAGHYKPKSGNYACEKCPANSYSHNTASANCQCRYGYYRARSESIDVACTSPPSEPTNLTFRLNQTSVNLFWGPPLNAGGRTDITYSITCKKCDFLFEQCTACSSTVDFDSNDRPHVTMTSSKINDLEPFSNYIFAVASHNGVSSVSKRPSVTASVRITTNGTVPPLTSGLRLLRSSPNSLTLKWDPPRHSQVLVLHYDVMIRPKNGVTSEPRIARATSYSVSINDLQPGTAYVIKVRGRSSSGYGPYSVPMTFTTDRESTKLPQTQNPAPVWLIAVVVGACVLVVIFIVAILVRRRRKQNREIARVEKKLDQGTAAAGLLNGQLTTTAGTNARKTYVDYRDPHQGVKEIACEVDAAKIKVERVIGQGEFGEVCRGKLIDGKKNVTVAIKRLRHGASLLDQTNFLREACTMAQFSDPNIVQFKGVVTKSMPAMILSEFMENGSLDRYLQKKKGELTVLQLLRMMRDVSSGMRYLSNMKYVHRDLAARNILLNSNLVCKVSDFGLSRTLQDKPHATYTTQGGKIALRWTAPESIRFRKFTSSSDVWSYGIVMWEVMSYGEKPYWEMTNDDVTRVIEDGYRLPAPENCPQALHQLMLQCWSYDENRRPTFQEILSRLNQLISHPTLLQNQEESLDFRAPLLSPDSATSLRDVTTLDEWLDMIELGRYRRSFYANGIKDLETLAHLSTSDLERLGIASSEHLSRLQSSLDSLRHHVAAIHTLRSHSSSVANTLPLEGNSEHPSSLPPQLPKLHEVAMV